MEVKADKKEEIIGRIKTYTFLISTSYESWHEERGIVNPVMDATFGCMYGEDKVLNGSKYTHNANSGYSIPPCVWKIKTPLEKGSHVGLGHIDLNIIGGILRLAGYLPASKRANIFWEFVAEVSTSGTDKMFMIMERLKKRCDRIGPDVCNWMESTYCTLSSWLLSPQFNFWDVVVVADCSRVIIEACEKVLEIVEDESGKYFGLRKKKKVKK
jgi:hypothetical protein